uniref:Uncharacterized protein n=1 Tax=Cucumis melo TaxID=3656 RepID=A0A9I9E596_CUCME
MMFLFSSPGNLLNGVLVKALNVIKACLGRRVND